MDTLFVPWVEFYSSMQFWKDYMDQRMLLKAASTKL